MAAASNINEQPECYSGTSRRRPNELSIFGFGDNCCIHLCMKWTLDEDKNKSDIGLFGFPTDPTLRKRWVNIVSKFRRRGAKDSFFIKKSTKICKFNFPINAIKVNIGQQRKSLVEVSMPSISKFRSLIEKKKRKSPRKRASLNETETTPAKLPCVDIMGNTNNEDLNNAPADIEEQIIEKELCP